jgi:DNA-binding CsgD family transcriptional regulator
MLRSTLLFGAAGGILIAALKWAEYRFLVVEHSFEVYGTLIAVIFAAVGIWLGLRMTRPQPETPAPEPVVPPVRPEVGLTRRELEILELVAQGMSNREIAEKLFVSENTIKTHCSHTFEKLGAKRRTQAVQLGKELGLIQK